MPRSIAVPPAVRDAAKAASEGKNLRSIAGQWGVDVATLRRVIDGADVHPNTLAKLEKIVERRRTVDEFKGNTARAAVHPIRTLAALSWSLETIRRARDAQMLGQFQLASRLADAMKTDDALYTAYHNRIAPQSAVAAVLKPARDSARAKAVQLKAAARCIVPRAVLAGINGTLADHGIAFGYIDQQPNKSGTRVEFRLEEWPIEFVRWNNGYRLLQTRTLDGELQTINHGDGRWIVFRKFEMFPWTREAAVLPGALCWAAHAYGLTDWASTARSHGQAKIVGTLPEGNALRDGSGELTQIAGDFLQMLQDLISGESGGGIAPFGSQTEFLSNGSTAWQVFDSLITDRKKAAAFIYLGTDATLGSVGGAPGVDISELFGVAATKIQGDFEAIEQGLNTGFYQPWTAINEGDSRYSPTWEYQLPDADAEQNVEQEDKRRVAFLASCEGWRKQGFVLTQDVVNKLAQSYRIDAPTLAPTSNTPPVVPDETDAVRALTINEVRRIIGAPPLTDSRGDMFLTQFEEASKAAAVASGKADPLKPDPIPGTTQPNPVPAPKVPPAPPKAPPKAPPPPPAATS